MRNVLDTSDKKDDKDEVRKSCRDVDDFSGWSNSYEWEHEKNATLYYLQHAVLFIPFAMHK